MNTPNNPSNNSFTKYIQKVQKELSTDYQIEVHVSLYLWSLKSDGVLNYEEKVWFSDRVKELYDVSEFATIRDNYTLEEFMEKARSAANSPLSLIKIADYFKAQKKTELCFELACFATYTGDREIKEKELAFLNKLAEVLELSESQKNSIQNRFA